MIFCTIFLLNLNNYILFELNVDYISVKICKHSRGNICQVTPFYSFLFHLILIRVLIHIYIKLVRNSKIYFKYIILI